MLFLLNCLSTTSFGCSLTQAEENSVSQFFVASEFILFTYPDMPGFLLIFLQDMHMRWIVGLMNFSMDFHWHARSFKLTEVGSAAPHLPHIYAPRHLRSLVLLRAFHRIGGIFRTLTVPFAPHCFNISFIVTTFRARQPLDSWKNLPLDAFLRLVDHYLSIKEKRLTKRLREHSTTLTLCLPYNGALSLPGSFFHLRVPTFGLLLFCLLQSALH